LGGGLVGGFRGGLGWGGLGGRIGVIRSKKVFRKN
jgi:hypothetical protein